LREKICCRRRSVGESRRRVATMSKVTRPVARAKGKEGCGAKNPKRVKPGRHLEEVKGPFPWEYA